MQIIAGRCLVFHHTPPPLLPESPSPTKNRPLASRILPCLPTPSARPAAPVPPYHGAIRNHLCRYLQVLPVQRAVAAVQRSYYGHGDVGFHVCSYVGHQCRGRHHRGDGCQRLYSYPEVGIVDGEKKGRIVDWGGCCRVMSEVMVVCVLTSDGRTSSPRRTLLVCLQFLNNA